MRVVIEDDELAAAIDSESIRFGFYRAVNAGGGAEPRGNGNGRVWLFPADETSLPERLEREEDDGETSDKTVRARLYAERVSDRRPVFGTTTLSTSDQVSGRRR